RPEVPRDSSARGILLSAFTTRFSFLNRSQIFPGLTVMARRMHIFTHRSSEELPMLTRSLFALSLLAGTFFASQAAMANVIVSNTTLPSYSDGPLKISMDDHETLVLQNGDK